MTADFMQTWIWPAGGSGGIWGDVVGSLLWVVIAGLITVAIWPRVRHIVERALGLDRLHRKLDHIILHHPSIPEFEPSSPSATPTTKGTTMFDLSSLENRFRSAELEAEEALHSKVAEAVESAAKIVLPLVPDGPLVEELLAEFDKLASKAHSVVSVTAAAATDAEAITAEAPAVAEEVATDVSGGQPA